jgi:hypothetical protein
MLHWYAVIYRWLAGYLFLTSASVDIATSNIAAEHAGTTETRARE